jgi:hypothetical protein
MRLGREILENDLGNATNVCVINEAFAKRFFDQRNPVGMSITLVNDDSRTSYQVVGVANNARTHSLRDDIAPRFFVTAKEPSSSANSPTFLIRAATETGGADGRAEGDPGRGRDGADPVCHVD